jgi:hypothetical protein
VLQTPYENSGKLANLVSETMILFVVWLVVVLLNACAGIVSIRWGRGAFGQLYIIFTFCINTM